MKLLNLLLVSTFIAVSLANASTSNLLTKLDQLGWENRIILVNVTEKEIDDFQKEFNDQQAEIDDRHIVWFIISTDKNGITTHSNFNGTLSQSLKEEVSSIVDEKKQRTVLIGKDGGIKSRSSSLNLEKIFSLIDSMPMRIYEMESN